MPEGRAAGGDEQQAHEATIPHAITGAIGPEAPDELSGLKIKFPRYWMQPVRDGYLAVPHGTYPILARNIEELGAKLQRPG